MRGDHPASVLRVDNVVVGTGETRARRLERLRTQHQFVPHDAVLALLDADRMDAGGGKIHRRGEPAVSFVVPAPSCDSRAVALLENDDAGGSRADPVDRARLRVHRVAELDEHRIVVVRIDAARMRNQR